MPGQGVRQTTRTALTALLVTVATVALSLLATASAGVHLLANTLLMMGGNDNPAAVTPVMQQELGGDPYYPGPNPRPQRPVGVFGQGYVDTAHNPNSPYFGWDYMPVTWPSQIGLPILGQSSYGESQRAGVQSITTALDSVLPTLTPQEQALAFGYSSSANVMVRTMRRLQDQPGGAPSTDQLQFFLMGNPNRPNGGLLQRFRGLYIPFVDALFDGSTPLDTPYQTTDVSWEYDGAADFPLYPLNLLAVVNSLIELHGNYFRADMNGPRAFPDVTVGNITYITLEAPHLPLLLPLYNIGFPQPLLDLVEPALTVMVDWGYDRSISPGTPTRARLIPRINPVTATVDLLNAVAVGIHDFIEGIKPAPPSLTPESPPAVTTVKPSTAVTASSARPDRAAPRVRGERVRGQRVLGERVLGERVLGERVRAAASTGTATPSAGRSGERGRAAATRIGGTVRGAA